MVGFCEGIDLGFSCFVMLDAQVFFVLDDSGILFVGLIITSIMNFVLPGQFRFECLLLKWEYSDLCLGMLFPAYVL